MLPPYAHKLGVALDPDDGERLRLVMPFSDDVTGRPGFLHGGAIAGLIEMAAIVALRRALHASDGAMRGVASQAPTQDMGAIEPIPPVPGAGIKPINVTLDFMRGGRERTSYASARVTRLGTRVANVEASAWQDDRDRPIASARMNYLILRDRV